MKDHICPECHTAFTPARRGQIYCRPACASRRRQRRYRASRLRQNRNAGQPPATVPVRTDKDEWSAPQRAEVSRLRTGHERRLHKATADHTIELATAYDRLHKLAVSADQAISTATALAERCRRLQSENWSLRQHRGQDLSDLQLLAARLVSFTTAGAHLGERVTDVFTRRGWSTFRTDQ
ncbi:hypothetical protein NG702_18780 [Pseudarthrobacter sp. MDT3-28]|uniref:hypothetical protein n=1 Tax=Pseudarthrobacter raffinosi TaxID=2953651 RepID=UPI00208FDE07|nr:hypothetical protein [Pseudarthrobacter sp. MDT3-28]MCO4239425.1 hypothetical protein [Pseudarthrobacter sp. MDT3-28]